MKQTNLAAGLRVLEGTTAWPKGTPRSSHLESHLPYGSISVNLDQRARITRPRKHAARINFFQISTSRAVVDSW